MAAKGKEKLNMGELLTIEKALSLRDSKSTVTVQALLISISEEVDRCGNPYIKGVLVHKNSKLEFRMWQTNMEQFTKLSGGTIPEGPIVQATGKIDEYQGTYSLTLSKGLSICDGDNFKVEDYLKSAPFPGDALIRGISKFCNEHIVDENIKTLVNKFLGRHCLDLSYYPYSRTQHTERGGWAYHIYLCLSRAKNYTSLPEGLELDKDLVYAALCCYKVSQLYQLEVNGYTSQITNQNDEEIMLYGELRNILAFDNFINDLELKSKIIAKQIEKGDTPADCFNFKIDGKIRLIQHIIATMWDKQLNPVIPEAMVTKEIVFAELKMNDMHEGLCNLAPGEVGNAFFNGVQKKVFKAWTDSESSEPEPSEPESSEPQQ